MDSGHFTDAAACHAAFLRAGHPTLDWSGNNLTDEHAEWIASALADPAVHVFQFEHGK
jgi:hypothetical protein